MAIELGYSRNEQMTVVLAREIRDDDVLEVGGAQHNVPFAASMLARELYTPNVTLLCTSLHINPSLEPLRYVGMLSTLFAREAEGFTQDYDFFQHFQNGKISAFFYFGLQIDKYGNVNLHCIGDFKKPKLRASGVVNIGIGVTAGRIYLCPPRHDRRTFVEKVDFISIPGHLEGSDNRAKAGMTTQGPVLCVTPLCVCDFHEQTKAMRLKSIHEGVTLEEIVANTGFKLIIPEKVPTTPPPTAEELDLLRSKIDPDGLLKLNSWEKSK